MRRTAGSDRLKNDRVSLERLKAGRATRKVERFAGRKVRIWSQEHGAFWRQDRRGYAVEPEAAGVFAFEEAYRARPIRAVPRRESSSCWRPDLRDPSDRHPLRTFRCRSGFAPAVASC